MSLLPLLMRFAREIKGTSERRDSGLYGSLLKGNTIGILPMDQMNKPVQNFHIGPLPAYCLLTVYLVLVSY